MSMEMSDEDFEQDEEEDFEESGEDNESPEGAYRISKDNIGFADADAIDGFLYVFEHEEATPHLKGKACKHAVLLLSVTDDFDQMIEVFRDFAELADENAVRADTFHRVIEEITTNLSGDNEMIRRFLKEATEIVDESRHFEDHLDLCLARAENAIKDGDFPTAESILLDREKEIQFPPDPNDSRACSAMATLLITRIEIAHHDRNFDLMFQLYEKYLKIKGVRLNNRQAGDVKFVEGLLKLKDRNFVKAKEDFYEAFKKFDDIGFSKRVEVVPYFVVSHMLIKSETVIDVFSTPSINSQSNHPTILPLKQLNLAFMANDIIEFDRVLPTALIIFAGEKNMEILLYEIRRIVLNHAVYDFCQSFTNVEVVFIANQLQVSEEDAQYAVVHLISNRILSGLYEDDTHSVSIFKKTEPSPFLSNVGPLIREMKMTLSSISRSERVHIRQSF